VPRHQTRSSSRSLLIALVALLSACLNRFVPAPEPIEDGEFFVHVVRAPDESLPKILTWYTGTTLSQNIVARYNPFVLERQLQVGDRIMIPVEVIANDKPYGEDAPGDARKVPNLLMGESETQQPTPSATPEGLENFNSDTDPDQVPLSDAAAPPSVQGVQPPADVTPGVL
jgi:hypothetical protein